MSILKQIGLQLTKKIQNESTSSPILQPSPAAITTNANTLDSEDH
jgi:hypothetical protein